MFLGWKIDDPLGAVQLHAGLHEHPADLHLARFAGGLVGREVRAEALLEHEGDALAHDADGVHRVDERVDAGVEQVALGESDHLRSTSREWISQ